MPLLPFHGTFGQPMRPPHVAWRHFHQAHVYTADRLPPRADWDSQYFSREEMISVLSTWATNPNVFRLRAKCLRYERHRAPSLRHAADSEKLKHVSPRVSARRLMFGIASRASPGVSPRCRTAVRHSGSVSRYRLTIHGIWRFDFKVAQPPPGKFYLSYGIFYILPMFQNLI